jgi:hypothetical protein
MCYGENGTVKFVEALADKALIHLIVLFLNKYETVSISEYPVWR